MLQGKNITLAPLKREYIDKFIEWLNDPEIIQYLTRDKPLTREMEEEWYDNLKNVENRIIFSILLSNENNKLIGNCGIEDINWKDRIGFCGIFIGDKKNQRKGYGTEALHLLINYGFNNLNLNRIELQVYNFNIGAIKCYEKVGFIEEGRKRQGVFKNGQYHDVIIMSILQKEWKIE